MYARHEIGPMQPRVRPQRRSLAGLQLANPDIAVAHRIAVILQRERKFVRTGLVGWPATVCGWAGEFDIVLHKDTVMKHGKAGRAEELPTAVEAWAVEDDVVPLPFARRPCSVHLRGILAVDRRSLAVGISSI